MRAREKEKKKICVLVHSSNGLNRLGWARLKPGSRNFTQVSHVDSRGPRSWAVICASSGNANREQHCKQQLNLTWHSLACQHCRQQLNRGPSRSNICSLCHFHNEFKNILKSFTHCFSQKNRALETRLFHNHHMWYMHCSI